MIFYEITNQDLKVGDHVKNIKTVVEYTRQEDNIELIIDDKFMISRYGISPHWKTSLILIHKHSKTIKDYMCGRIFHAKLIKP
jgi:hypothetical protein